MRRCSMNETIESIAKNERERQREDRVVRSTYRDRIDRII